jgi:hypothetical protein
MRKKIKDLFLNEVAELDEELDGDYEDEDEVTDEEDEEVTEETDTTSAEGGDGTAFDSEEEDELLGEEDDEEEFSDDDEGDEDNIDIDVHTDEGSHDEEDFDGEDEGGDEEVAVDLDSEDTEPDGDETVVDDLEAEEDDEAEIDEASDELDLDDPTDELADEEDDEEILEVFDDEIEDDETDEELEDEPYMESYKALNKKMNALIKEHKKLRKVVKAQRASINETDLYLSKIAVTTRLISNDSLSAKQKSHIIEAIDHAKNEKEVKKIYSVLSESFALGNIGKGIKSIIKENTMTSSSSTTSPTLIEPVDVKRMQHLAGIPD